MKRVLIAFSLVGLAACGPGVSDKDKPAYNPDGNSSSMLSAAKWRDLKGDYEKALSYLNQADHFLDDPVIYEHLGDVYEKVGTYGKALKAYRKALEKAKQEDKAKIDKKIEKIKKLLSNR